MALSQEGTHLPEEVWGEEKTGRGPRGSLQARQGEAGRRPTAGVTQKESHTDKTEDDKLERNQSVGEG